jgi:protein-S-isoprenylcysteine O-methyltransferase Ste14
MPVTNPTDFLFRHRVHFHAVFVIVAVVLAHPTAASILCALPVVILGEAIRFWSAGHLDKALVGKPGSADAPLTTSGPYAHTRNPLYVGNFLIGVGFCLTLNQPWLAVAFIVMFAAVYAGTMRKEEIHLVGLFGDAYREYARRVPRFLPRLTPYPEALDRRFSWERVGCNKEYRTMWTLVAVLAVIALEAIFLPSGILGALPG